MTIRIFSVLVSFAVLACTSCTKKSPFPGYESAGATPHGQYFVETKSIQSISAAVNFNALIQAPDRKSYSMFSASTDCRRRLVRFEGAEYNSEGVVLRNVPPDPSPTEVPAELAGLVSKACQIALDKKSISGEFDVAKAMEATYGSFDRTRNASLVKVDPDVSRHLSGASQGWVKVVEHVAFTEKSVPKHLIVTAAIPATEDFTCHVCSPVIGLQVFRKSVDRWVPETDQRFLTADGHNGNAPSVKTFQVAPDITFIGLLDGDMSQGYISGSIVLFGPASNGVYQQVFSGNTDSDNCGATPDRCTRQMTTYSFEPVNNFSYYEMRARTTTKEISNEQVLSSSEDVKSYFYLDGKYASFRDMPTDQVLRAADNGWPAAEFTLGTRYASGVGVERDNCEAAKWLRSAVQHGSSDAGAALLQLEQSTNGVLRYCS